MDVDILTVIEPLDAAVAAAVKCDFKQEFARRLAKITIADSAKRERSDTLRYLMCDAFIDTSRKASTKSNCESGFRRAGIVPLDP
jgi:hypothetical protein